MWEGHRLLEGDRSPGGRVFADEFVKDRAGRSLAHVFTLLSLVLPFEPLQISYRGLHTDDDKLRGTALEYLESVLPKPIREGLWPFLEERRKPVERTSRPRERDSCRPDAVESVHRDQPGGAPRPGEGRQRDEHVKLIAPRAQTPAPTGSSGIRTSGRIPEELLRDQVRRLAASSVVIAGCWAFGLVMDSLVVPGLMGFPRNPTPPSRLKSPAWRCRRRCSRTCARSEHRSDTKTTMGLVFMVANALGIAVLNASALRQHDAEPPDGVVDGRAHPVVCDDLADVAAADAHRGLDGRDDGSVGRLDPVPRGPSDDTAAPGAAPLSAELHLGGHFDRAVQGDARPRQTAAGSAGSGQLSARRTARPGRDGRSLARRAPAARAQRRGQAGPARGARAPAARRTRR